MMLYCWIGEYTRGMDHDTFLANHLVQDAVLKQIEVIGEVCKASFTGLC